MPLSLSRTLREIHRLGREAPAATFQDDAFEAMKALIRFDYGYWGAGREPAESVVMHYSFLHRLPAAEMSAAFEKCKSHPKMVESIYRNFTNSGQAIVFNVREAGLDFFYGPFGIDQLVTVYRRDDNLGLYNVLSLYRSGEERFTEQERLLFESLVPHLWDAWGENKLLNLSDANRDASPLTPASALVDGEGAIHFARPAFTEFMRCEWPDWRGPFVPEVMRRMRDGSFCGKEMQGGKYIGEAVAARIIPQHDLYLIVLRRKGPLDQLTERELEVAKHLARGSCHKEIARHLAIAPATARNHIANIHAKLGSNKAAQVATMLMNEGML